MALLRRRRREREEKEKRLEGEKIMTLQEISSVDTHAIGLQALNGQDNGQQEQQQEESTQPTEQPEQSEQQQQQEDTKQLGSLVSSFTQAQIDAISDPVLRQQVQQLVNSNKQLAIRAKEKDPTWQELGKYGKGTAGIKVSDNGTLQITGTRRAFGGLYIFPKEMVFILEHQKEIVEFALNHRQLIQERTAAAEAAREKQKNDKK